jgi:putative ABC transport system ATP-binding protein
MTVNTLSGSSILQATGVTRRFRTRAETVTAVDNVSFGLDAGELVGLVGPSGSGKTTLLHLVMGWEHPDSGAIARRDDMPAGWAGLAVVPQELGLLPELTVRQNVELAGRLGGRSAEPVEGLLEELGLVGLAERLPTELSLGEQQRVAVARAAVCSPILLIADEPTAHQDELHADGVIAVLARVAGLGGTVLVATHDDRVLTGVDRVLRIVDGRLVTS